MVLTNDNVINQLADQLGRLLTVKHWTVTTAESCTGGGIAQAITAIPGSSRWFEQGLVTYSDHAKSRLLQVEEQLLRDHGAVSRQVVEAMAAGALRFAEANCAIAVSGIAGPDGGTLTKPVGTVWIAWGMDNDTLVSQCFQFPGDRHQVRRQTIIEALQGLKQRIEQNR